MYSRKRKARCAHLITLATRRDDEEKGTSQQLSAPVLPSLALAMNCDNQVGPADHEDEEVIQSVENPISLTGEQETFHGNVMNTSSPAPPLEPVMQEIFDQWQNEEENIYNPSIESAHSPYEDVEISDDDATYVPEGMTRMSSESASEMATEQPQRTQELIRLETDQNGDNVYNNTNTLQASGSTETSSKPFARKSRRDRKKAIHAGQAYSTSKGKHIPCRKMRDLPPCRNKCETVLTHDTRQSLFTDYWSLGSIEKRRAYVSLHINTQQKKTIRLRDDRAELKNRQVTHTYNFTVSGKRIKVCKACFCSTLDETGRFIRTVIKKKEKSLSGIPEPDSRGKQTPPHKHPPQVLERVKNHILSFPSYESHYTRRTNDKRYLPTYLTQQMMYDLYCEKEEKPVSKKLYYKEFHSLNLSIKKPKQDTCHKCDTLIMKKKAAQSEDEKNAVDNEHKNHIESADYAYLMKKLDQNDAKNSANKKTFTFDLQQCLATPMLASSVCFYKRQLWTFNLTIHDGVTGQSYNYMWHEAIAGRGANEIASCLYNFLSHELPSTVTEVTFYSDTCGGQNKNSHVAAMFLKLVEESSHINVVNHKFLVPGHTHMECDVDHALIEKKKKKAMTPIYHPHDWYQLVRSTGKKHPFKVHEMQQCEFLNFQELLTECLVIRKKNEENEPFKWHDTKWIQYRKDTKRILHYKTDLTQENFKALSFIRRGRGDDLPLTVRLRYDRPNPISVEKKKDLQDMLPLIPTIFHDFFKNLPTKNSVRDEDPDLQEFEAL